MKNLSEMEFILALMIQNGTRFDSAGAMMSRKYAFVHCNDFSYKQYRQNDRSGIWPMVVTPYNGVCMYRMFNL
jgi:hypothetical protein